MSSCRCSATSTWRTHSPRRRVPSRWSGRCPRWRSGWPAHPRCPGGWSASPMCRASCSATTPTRRTRWSARSPRCGRSLPDGSSSSSAAAATATGASGRSWEPSRPGSRTSRSRPRTTPDRGSRDAFSTTSRREWWASTHQRIVDRLEAIHAALDQGRKGDTILLAGQGTRDVPDSGYDEGGLRRAGDRAARGAESVSAEVEPPDHSALEGGRRPLGLGAGRGRQTGCSPRSRPTLGTSPRARCSWRSRASASMATITLPPRRRLVP